MIGYSSYLFREVCKNYVKTFLVVIPGTIFIGTVVIGTFFASNHRFSLLEAGEIYLATFFFSVTASVSIDFFRSIFR